MATKVTRYQASDGELFEREDHANIYDGHLELLAYLDEHPIRKYITGKSLLKWAAERAPRLHLTLLPEEEHGD